MRSSLSSDQPRIPDLVQADPTESADSEDGTDPVKVTNQPGSTDAAKIAIVDEAAPVQTTSQLEEGNKAPRSQIGNLVDIARTWPQYKDKIVQVQGLVQSIRSHKKVTFVELSDGTTYKTLQLVLSPKLAEPVHNGAYIAVEGQLKAGRQSYELQVSRVKFLTASDPKKSPIQKKAMSVDHLREHPHMRLRLPSYALLSRVRSSTISSVWSFYSSPQQRMTYVQPPIITSSDCEGAGETFTLTPRLNPAANAAGQTEKSAHYFRTPKYLTVSSQLHLEAFSAALGDVWTLSPTFRAEQSDTSRHLSEFWMLEAEYREKLNTRMLMDRVQGLIQRIVRTVVKGQLRQELAAWSDAGQESSSTLEDRRELLLLQQWTRLKYSDAIELLSTFPNLSVKPTWDTGLHLEHEKALCEHYGKPVFVMDYPQAQKPFYMLGSSRDGPKTVRCFDLLLPGFGEVAGGSLREHRLEHLIINMREKGLLKRQAVKDASGAAEDPKEDLYPHLQPGESLNTLQWYADLRRFGTQPHAGFGLGFDRLLMYITGINNVRDIVPFPRTWGTAHC